jgi:hypothetical protein
MGRHPWIELPIFRWFVAWVGKKVKVIQFSEVPSREFLAFALVFFPFTNLTYCLSEGTDLQCSRCLLNVVSISMIVGRRLTLSVPPALRCLSPEAIFGDIDTLGYSKGGCHLYYIYDIG